MIPVVSVILCHHLDENVPYLNQTLESLKRQDGAVPFEVILLSDAPTCPEADPGVFVVHDRNLINATQKAVKGIELANRGTQFYLFLSDDVVLASHTISTLVQTAGNRMVIMNPMSNGDNGAQFHAPWLWGPDLDRGDVPVDLVYSFPRHPVTLVERPYICFYCTLIPKRVYEAVGSLDERLDKRHNDEDYCYRAKHLGIPSLINLGAFALHYGSKTFNVTVKREEQEEATRVFREKYTNV